ncbi:MAG: hypothetical protein IT236_08525 [Bacteroidia bacterium]|nr:hypothetical protein [Bacteroidia bacterium]
MKFNLHLTGLLLLFILSNKIGAQNSNYNSKNYRKEPLWISMMDDPNANYFETLKAFREFWKDRVLPKEPFETEGADTFEKEVGLEKEGESEKERERERERELKKQNKRGDQSTHQYASQVRAFKGWMQTVKPWVRPDGSIISDTERQAIIDKQAKELKELELKNGKN